MSANKYREAYLDLIGDNVAMYEITVTESLRFQVLTRQ
jgi:hypothetical protein